MAIDRGHSGQGGSVQQREFRRETCEADAPKDIDDDPLALSRQWHREYEGICEGADKNDYFASGIQTIYYLDDVDETTHCTSIIPESAETKRSLPKTRGESSWGDNSLMIADRETAFVDPEKPLWMDSFGREGPRRLGRVDVHAPAGSAVMFNLLNYHCGTVRKTDRIRAPFTLCIGNRSRCTRGTPSAMGLRVWRRFRRRCRSE